MFIQTKHELEVNQMKKFTKEQEDIKGQRSGRAIHAFPPPLLAALCQPLTRSVCAPFASGSQSTCGR